LKKVSQEKEQLEVESHKKEQEIKDIESQLRILQEQWEREQLKTLTYRKEDIMDLISSLNSMDKVIGH
jgi:flagellar motility protein MotE (MotC chaperone)